jgi:DNA mismatch repair protein MutS
MRVTEWKGDVVFLHEVVPGRPTAPTASRSPSSPGLPPAVVERARTILGELEKSEREKPVASLVDDLPLFAVPQRRAAAPPVLPAEDPLRLALDGLDLDEMTPREALEALYRLKGMS